MEMWEGGFQCTKIGYTEENKTFLLRQQRHTQGFTLTTFNQLIGKIATQTSLEKYIVEKSTFQ